MKAEIGPVGRAMGSRWHGKTPGVSSASAEKGFARSSAL